MGEMVKRSVVTVVTERVEIRGTSEQLAEAAPKVAPYAEGWRFVMQWVSEGLTVERYEREGSREVAEVEGMSAVAAPPVQTNFTHKTRRRKW